MQVIFPSLQHMVRFWSTNHSLNVNMQAKVCMVNTHSFLCNRDALAQVPSRSTEIDDSRIRVVVVSRKQALCRKGLESGRGLQGRGWSSVEYLEENLLKVWRDYLQSRGCHSNFWGKANAKPLLPLRKCVAINLLNPRASVLPYRFRLRDRKSWATPLASGEIPNLTITLHMQEPLLQPGKDISSFVGAWTLSCNFSCLCVLQRARLSCC